MVARIDRVNAGGEDGRVLDYVRSQITPSGLMARGEENQDIKHLTEVAIQRLRPYEKESHPQ